ncbi:MAG TPA: A/G-specific adenine glycosylase [Acidimicrobiales bacterium]|nr:A/G-specific adenine glycosylase [Acidimicrobiales bacterium]
MKQRALLEWSARSRRDLPWRRTRDPWAVLVSELMLQQTQVPRVVPKYEAFLGRFPTVAACAAAPVGEVVKAWAGLGYNRRAVNLHRAAVALAGAPPPCDLAALLALPGIGPYTARAVLAFAYEEPVCPLDVNTARPLARAFGVRTQAEADALVPPGRSWQWNQALMDLGATVCTRRAPRCDACPLAGACRWQARGGPDPAAPAGRQSPFAGSDRQGRGRLVDAMRRGPVPLQELGAAAGWPDDPARARRAADSLVADGLAVLRDGALALP